MNKISKKNTMSQKIDFEKFEQIDLRVGKVIEAQKIEKSDKLIKLQVELGEKKPRQIIAGIAPFYEEEELEGREVIVVANLEAVELMGKKSNGMVLCAHNEEKGECCIAEPEKEIEPGTKVV